MFAEIRIAIEAGQRDRAREMLTHILRVDNDNANAWVWMSAVVDSPRERIYCLKEALRIDPNHPAAKRGLAILGAQPADHGLVVPPELERSQRHAPAEKTPSPILSALPKKPGLYVGAGVIAVGLILFAIFSSNSRAKQTGPLSTIDYQPVASATSATGSPTPPPPTATPLGPTPPWNVLSEPYTPTPAYVRTPHMVIEAYSIAIRAFERGEWDQALDYMVQAATSQPDSADIPYQIGEIYRRGGDFNSAFDAYNKSIAIDASFAPAYLGRAQAGLEGGLIDDSTARADLETAVQLDPILPEARLELALLDLNEGLYQPALDQLQTAELLLPGSPWVYLLRGRVYLAQGEPRLAQEQARLANQLDLTLLPVYLLSGEALQADGQWSEAVEPLEIYLRYIDAPDARAQVLIARSYAAAGDWEKAIAAVNAALEVDPNDADVLLLRGDFYLEQGQADLALADFRQSLRLEPGSFAAGLAVGRAQLALGAYREAYQQINKMERSAASDEQKGQLYYWRAQSLEGIGEPAAAMRDWQRLLDLPEGSAPEEWRQTARERIGALATPTPTLRPTTPAS